MTAETSVHVEHDSEHGATVSPALLEAAGLTSAADLVARVESPGRIVLESPETVLARVQGAVRRGKAAAVREALLAGEEPPADLLADELMAERARDTSLEGYRPSDSWPPARGGSSATWSSWTRATSSR